MSIAALVLIAALLPSGFNLHVNYAPTPALAAVQVIWDQKPVSVIRTNIAGRFATVLTHGGLLESVPVTYPILLEHFSFGWQAIDGLSSGCNLESHGIDLPTRNALMIGMPGPVYPKSEDCAQPDIGLPAELDAVHHLMKFALVHRVMISGNYAVGEWYAAGGGEMVFRFTNGRWVQIAGGGGAHTAADLRPLGVPESALCAFKMPYAKCPAKR